MNTLDDLLSSAGRVDGITPDIVRNGRAALDEAITRASMQNEAMPLPGTHASRKAASRWFGGLRGKTIAGVAVVAAAAAAVATVVAAPSSSPHSKTTPQAGSSSHPTVTAKPTPSETVPAVVQTSAPAVSYTFTATADVTAAYVLSQAAQGSQATDVQLVNGWPDAPYWHILSQGTDSACPGVVFTSNDWLDPSGDGVGDNTRTGPKSSNLLCGNGGDGKFPIAGGNSGPMIGGEVYTWSQFAALPTDPAKLWPILKADETTGIARSKGEPVQDWLFQTISMTLTTDPVSPAMRKALYEVTEKIPGVTVAGTYTDSLGRTGTALRLGSWTMVVDASNGRVLATLMGAPPLSPGCARASMSSNAHATCVVAGASTTLYISEGPAPAASVPDVPGYWVHGLPAATSSASPSGSSR